MGEREPTVIERMVMAYHKAESAGVADETEAMLAAMRELEDFAWRTADTRVPGDWLRGLIEEHLAKSDTGSKG